MKNEVTSETSNSDTGGTETSVGTTETETSGNDIAAAANRDLEAATATTAAAAAGEYDGGRLRRRRGAASSFMTVLPPEWRRWSVVLGGFLLHLTYGAIGFGNMFDYVPEYVRAKVDPTYTFEESTWIFSEMVMARGAVMAVGAYMAERYVGPRAVAVVGSVVALVGIFLTALAVSISPALVIFSYGIVYGCGVGLAFAVPLSCATRMFTENRGFVAGIIIGAQGFGAAIFALLKPRFVDPENVLANAAKSGNSQEEVLTRVPLLFLALGGCFAVAQLFGCALMPRDLPAVEENLDDGLRIVASGRVPEGILETLSPSSVKKPGRKRGPEETLNRASNGPYIISDRVPVLMHPNVGRSQTGTEDLVSLTSGRTRISALSIHSSWNSVYCPSRRPSSISQNNNDVPCSGIAGDGGAERTKANEFVSDDRVVPQESAETFQEVPAAVSTDLSLTPRQVVQTTEFHMLWITAFLTHQAVGFVHTSFKVMAQSVTSDRHFISSLGIAAALLNPLGKVVWGALEDRSSYRRMMMAATGATTVVLATFGFVRYGGAAGYAVWVTALFLATAATVSLYPGVVSRTFGPTWAGTNYGLLCSSSVVSQAVQTIVAEQLRRVIGDLGVAAITGLCACAAFLITRKFDPQADPRRIRRRLAFDGVPKTDVPTV